MTDNEGLRLFFAVTPAPAVTRRLATLAGRLAVLTGGRAQAAANLHLTLAFLGNVPRAQLPALKAIGNACRHHPASPLTLTRIATLRSVVCIEPERTPMALATLQSELARALTAAGFQLESRRFRPHLSLVHHARAPVPPGAGFDPVDFALDHLVLMHSVLLPQGARHTELGRWPLQRR